MTEQKKTVKKKKKAKPKKAFKIFKIIVLSILFLILTSGVIGFGYVYAVIKNTPKLKVDKVLSLNQPSKLFDNKNNVMDNVITDEQRFVIGYDAMPENLRNAFVAIEDERFYSHKGVDPKRMVGAVFANLKNAISGKKGLQGASTLTQQLLKNTVLTNDQTLERKVKEIYLALDLEKSLSKEQIMEAYLNTIPLGGQVYGVEAASIRYFNKPAKDLTLLECAYIAGITQAPSYYDALSPNSKKNPTPFLNRTKTVIQKMYDIGKITKEQYDSANNDLNEMKKQADEGTYNIANTKFAFNPAKKSQKMDYEWFSRPVVKQVIADLKEKYKYTDEQATKLIVNGGLQIYTTMDKNLQDYTQAALNDRANIHLDSKNVDEFDKNGVPLLQASATIMDYRTGEVKAMVGGRGNQGAKSNNRAFSDLRSIGSATKPLTVYGPAVDMKLMGPGTTMEDSPLSGKLAATYPNWNPQNESRRFTGTKTLRVALRESINLIAIKVEDAIGYTNGIAYGEKFGLKYNNKSKTSIAAASLGQFDNSPQDRDGGNTYLMAAAYGAFGNSGTYTEPILYTKVLDLNGQEILTNSPKTRNVISPQAAYILYDMLKEPVNNYSAKPAKEKLGDIPVAGKTGTTDGNKDLWFAGLTPYLSAAIWVGYDVPREMKGHSGTAVTPLWGLIMGKAHEGLAYKEIPEPSGISKAGVCMDSGKTPTDLCSKDPRGQRITSDFTIGGGNSSALCDAHVLVKINKSNGKLANANTPADLIEDRVFIKKEYASDPNASYVVPTEQDDSKPSPKQEPVTPVPPNTNNNGTNNNPTNGNNNSGAGTGGNGNPNGTNNNGNTGTETQPPANEKH
ncbi:penicillin-binding protein 1A [Clostridium cavendishii DSM 21758]|uniref:Penicillin-binding protein 1A n=1 Tax=Clostridium cavendishii DSM 21758 TaxID=1121302 RepID=A0A1M6AFP7_9CLOT|nr:PBP1A family penicillin-binding protein [Clostridium cavendishii]SHI35295.1 penicillin-binding protein 1A [Clostridium cavendishii DSM 21758]